MTPPASAERVYSLISQTNGGPGPEAKMAAELGLSIPTVQRAIASLIEADRIKTERANRRQPNRYQILDGFDASRSPKPTKGSLEEYREKLVKGQERGM